MRSTMQDTPLSITRILKYGTTVHSAAEVVSWTTEGPRRRTYAEVGRRAAQLANALRALGIDGDQRVASFQWNNAEHLEVFLTVPSMGAVLHTLNLRLFPDQLTYIANHAEDKIIIVDNTLVPLLARVLAKLITVEHVIVVGPADTAPIADAGKQLHDYEELLAAQPDTFDWVEPADERDAAAMCYTSGTTGDPKGVVYSHRSIYLHSLQILTRESFGINGDDRILAIVPMFHAMAWGLPYACLMAGSTLLMPDRFLQAEPLAKMIAAEKPTFGGAVPTVFADLLSYLDSHDVDTSSLKEVVIGGSACPPALMAAYRDRHQIDVIHAWGMTETSPLGSVSRPPAGATADEAWEYRKTQGRFPAAVQFRLAGPDGNLVPTDGVAVGELEVRGPWVAGSYHGDAAPPEEKFHDGWLRTGDVGMVTPNGYLTLTDRSKDVIKSGGEWISSVELENHLMGHPKVAEASVVGVPTDARWDERPLAAVVVREGEQVSAAELRDFLAAKVARWQLPERWTFIDEVPKTSVGKFDKKRIRARYADGELEVITLK
ncbi:long-chain fatty acid--CoA ligase [Fodinicola feengrottensis]|uniref:long-chain fatty acid--CoA ligase n=1 Tax=Fodinicola feengrottensis TaxID=435914 RepID=UPI0013D420FC|nr:long-chain fatty acid--CoA ligase [Fodinicola feengrottensis]